MPDPFHASDGLTPMCVLDAGCGVLELSNAHQWIHWECGGSVGPSMDWDVPRPNKRISGVS